MNEYGSLDGVTLSYINSRLIQMFKCLGFCFGIGDLWHERQGNMDRLLKVIQQVSVLQTSLSTRIICMCTIF